jgi:hypothetical protein
VPNPLYNYGAPVVVTGSGTPAVTTGEVENGGSNGTPHTPPANTATVVNPGGSPSEELVTLYTPTLASISPTTAVKGGADLTLTCTGTKFVTGSQITFNGGVENTTYVSATTLTTVVKPSLVTVAGGYPVTVRNGSLETAPRTFTFT